MIIRVWGIVNDAEVEFTPIPERPGYWEGFAPRVPGIQDIEIWAESDSGGRGHLRCTVQIQYHAHTKAQLTEEDKVHLLLLPFAVTLLKNYEICMKERGYLAQYKYSRKVGLNGCKV